MPGQRIVVIGTTGSGKTTLARQLVLWLDYSPPVILLRLTRRRRKEYPVLLRQPEYAHLSL